METKVVSADHVFRELVSIVSVHLKMVAVIPTHGSLLWQHYIFLLYLQFSWRQRLLLLRFNILPFKLIFKFSDFFVLFA